MPKPNDLIIDSFAGGGGASLGIEWALGRGPDVAINHNPAAIEMHRENHPGTHHYTEDVFKVNPQKATNGKPVGLLWASPDCRHHSRARGGKPVAKNIRGLAWAVIKWADTVRPRVIVLENVREFAVVNPLLAHLTHGGERRSHPADEPTPTVTGANRGELGLIAPVVANLAHGDSADGRDRGLRANAPDAPLGTVHAGGGSYALVAPYLYPRYGETGEQAPRTASVEAPMPTVVQTGNGAMLCAAFIAKHFGGMVGVQADTPLPTTTARGTQNQLAAVNLIHMNHGEKTWNAVEEPLRTVTTGKHAALVASFMVRYFGKSVATPLDRPLPTACGEIKDGLVTVSIAGEPYVIVDIGMRMLKPRELARAQGFPDSYKLTGTATSQVERIGNSVCPHVAAALVRANCPELARKAVAA